MIHDAEFLLIVSILIIVALILAWQKVTYKAQLRSAQEEIKELKESINNLRNAYGRNRIW